MEKRNIVFLDKFSPEYEAIKEKQIKDKEEALKIFGDYLISLTEICFEKCIDTQKIKISKIENQCIDNCHEKLHKLHYKTFSKFYNEENFNIRRSYDYGDIYDLYNYLDNNKKSENKNLEDKQKTVN